MALEDFQCMSMDIIATVLRGDSECQSTAQLSKQHYGGESNRDPFQR